MQSVLKSHIYYFSSGRRETPYLDAKLNKLNKYSSEANLRNLTTERPYTSYTTSSYNTTSTFKFNMISTASPRVYDSGEDPTLESGSESDDDNDDDIDDLDEDEDIDDEEDIDMEEKTNVDNIGLAVTNLGEGTNPNNSH